MIKGVMSVSKNHELFEGNFCEVIKIEFSLIESIRDRIVVICKPNDVANIEWSYRRPGTFITYHISDEEYARIKTELMEYIVKNKLFESYPLNETGN